MEPVVHLRAAVCLLGRFPALAGIDLEVEPGEIVLLRGPNGAGKTTLLRALAGLIPVVDGQAEVLGHDLRLDRRSVRSHIGLLGHESGLYEDLSVTANVAFWTRACGGSKESANSAIERVGMDGRLSEVVVSRLSAGQRRRASLAVLLARDCQLWLLDEPHAGLDAAGRDLLDGLIRSAGEQGKTVLLASHELDRAVPLASRVVIISGGQTRPDGSAPQATSTSTPTSASEVTHVA